MPTAGQAGRRSRHGGGERELEGLGRGVVVERECVGENDGGGDGGEVVVEERLCGGTARAVDGRVVDAGEAYGLEVSRRRRVVAGSQAPDGSETRRCTPWPLESE